MITELITGSFTSGVHERIVNEIKALTEKGIESILIVPEQQTLSAEKEMSKKLPANAPLYFEVSNFTRFANSVFRKKGGLTSEHSDRARRALVMWQALTELSPLMKVLSARDAVTAGLVNKAISALNEIESLGIEAAALAEASETAREENPRLADKLDDLALLSTVYKKLLAEKYSDLGDEVGLLCEKLEEFPDFLVGANIYIENFTSFTEAQYKLIGILMKRANVKIALYISRHAEDSFEFSETRLAKSRITKIANKRGAELKLTRLDGNKTTKSPLLSEISDLLWKANGKIDNESLHYCDALRIFEAKDPYEECSFAAADIKRRVSLGARYSDFAIIARNAESYVGTLDDALRKNGVPHFISKTKDISTFEAVKLIYTALSSVITGFAREEVLSYAKCAFSGISRDACDEFELYVEKWQLTGKRFADGIDWNMRPEGYTLRREAGSDESLIRINETKETLLAPLISLSAKFESAKTVRDFAFALTEFLTEAELEEKIAKRSQELYLFGEKETAEENAALWQIICDSFDTLVEAAGDSEADAESFKNRLELVLSEAKIGRIPSFNDEVTVGSADILRLSGKAHIYIIGANLGEFPSVPKDLAFFGDRDKAKLQSYGIEMAGSSEFDYARELFYFSRAFASASESVTLLFADADFAFKAQKPSEPVEKIQRLTEGRVFPRKISELPPREIIFSKEAAISLINENDALKASLIELGYEKEIKKNELSIKNEDMLLSPEIAKLMYPGDLFLTQTRIDKYIDCPLAYFCQYKLSLSENEKAEFDARNIGSFIHSILENFFLSVRHTGKNASELSSEERQKIASNAAGAYLESLGSDSSRRGRASFSLERLKNSALPVIDELCDELSSCSFEPRFFELAIENDKEGAPTSAKFQTKDGKFTRIFGSIDRVDTYKSGDDVYIRVIDYKTGAKSFSPDDLDEGRNLQMFLYLKSLVETSDKAFLAKVGVTENGKLIPAGVIYIKADISDVKIEHTNEADALSAVKAKQKREGMLLDDAESIGAMNKAFIPISYKKDGSPTANSEKYLYTPSGWDEISEKIQKAVIKVSDEMKSGNISAKPMKNKKNSPCSYCKFKPICRNAK